MDANVEAARPWVTEAAPDYLTLVDTEHVLSSLFNFVNVPQAVWIDETGQIVRPPEAAGSVDILRDFDLQAGGFKPEALERAQQGKAVYTDAVRDWARHGSESRFAFAPNEVRERLPELSADAARAHACFRLGRFLADHNRPDEAEMLFAEARDLHPDSWNIFRETTEKMDIGIAAGEAYWAKVMSLGDKAYYEPVDMDGLRDL